MTYPPRLVGRIAPAPVEVFTLPGRGTCWAVQVSRLVVRWLLAPADPLRVPVWVNPSDPLARGIVMSWPVLDAQLSLFGADDEEARIVAAYDMDPRTCQPYDRSRVNPTDGQGRTV